MWKTKKWSLGAQPRNYPTYTSKGEPIPCGARLQISRYWCPSNKKGVYIMSLNSNQVGTVIIRLRINANKVICVRYERLFTIFYWFHGQVVSTLDFESSNSSSNLGGTFFTLVLNSHNMFEYPILMYHFPMLLPQSWWNLLHSFLESSLYVWVSHSDVSLHYVTPLDTIWCWHLSILLWLNIWYWIVGYGFKPSIVFPDHPISNLLYHPMDKWLGHWTLNQITWVQVLVELFLE